MTRGERKGFAKTKHGKFAKSMLGTGKVEMKPNQDESRIANRMKNEPKLKSKPRKRQASSKTEKIK